MLSEEYACERCETTGPDVRVRPRFSLLLCTPCEEIEDYERALTATEEVRGR